MLRSLHLKDVGPAARFDLTLGERLNVLTGDNGLGKSFVLDVAWWALTGGWIDKPVLPARGKEDEAEIALQLDLPASHSAQLLRASYWRAKQDWHDPIRGPASDSDGVPEWLQAAHWAPVVYARAEGGFAVWDPARSYPLRSSSRRDRVVPRPYQFDLPELWNGLGGENQRISEGLIRDWTRWWLEAAAGRRQPFDLLARVLAALSHPDEPMRPAEPRRVFLDDARDYPTIDLPYGNVSVAHLSAGMRRIVSLAYLLAWTWSEHERACGVLGHKPAAQIFFLIDEVESHLHPRWQRHITPALLGVLEGLGSGIKAQVMLTTHSPLVLASIEPIFDRARDKLFLFELHDREVKLREEPWTKYGDAAGWLVSPVFGLEQARSREAERAIKAAYDFMAGRRKDLPKDLRTEKAIHAELTRVLPADDPFWVQWIAEPRRARL